jgi:hypothetical protein
MQKEAALPTGGREGWAWNTAMKGANTFFSGLQKRPNVLPTDHSTDK